MKLRERSQFCFPYAGGGASVYKNWIHKLCDLVTVCPVQLPGREERIMEEPYFSMEELLEDLEKAIEPFMKHRTIFWGHSMGAKIAFALEKRFESKEIQAECLIVSGSRTPDIPEPDPIFHLSDKQFKEKLSRFEGTPKEILENQELLDFFLSMLRADFTLDETYFIKNDVALNSPIIAMGGREDNEVKIEEIRRWKEYTKSTFQYYMYPGGHFFIREQELDILYKIRSVIDKSC